MKIMITGTRAPAALDLIRTLNAQGHIVFSADSMRFPLSRFSNCVSKHIRLPSPNRNLIQYKDALIQAIIKHKIDWLIPTCEEIFFISRFHEELSQYCLLFLEPLEKLKNLHNKYDIMSLIQECDILIPETTLLNSNKDKKNLKNVPLVIKPVYSRFASFVLIKPSQKQIDALTIDKPYVAQEFIEGKEFCVYSLAQKGKLIARAAYHPKYTAGAGAGIYFEPAHPKDLDVFLEKIIAKINFTGQISFDFIENSNGLYVLECNPRATSGLHLLVDKINWQEALNGIPQITALSTQPKMLKFAMLSYELKALLSPNAKAFFSDYKQAQDVLNHPKDGWMHLKSIVSIMEICYRGLRFRKNFKNAATDDIEWNGESL